MRKAMRIVFLSKTRRFRNAIILVCAVSGAGCATAPSERPATDSTEAPEIRVALAADVVKVGEPLQVDVTIDTHGVPPFRLDFGTGCQFTWVITSGEDRVVTRHMMCTQAPSHIELGPDGRHQRRLEIPTARTYQEGWPFAEDWLPAGGYRLEVYLLGYEDRFRTHVVWFEVVG
jgi:hypothetical protein